MDCIDLIFKYKKHPILYTWTKNKHNENLCLNYNTPVFEKCFWLINSRFHTVFFLISAISGKELYSPVVSWGNGSFSFLIALRAPRGRGSQMSAAWPMLTRASLQKKWTRFYTFLVHVPDFRRSPIKAVSTSSTKQFLQGQLWLFNFFII